MHICKRLLRLCAVLGFIWLVVWLGLFIFASTAARRILISKIQQASGERTSIGSVRLDPFLRLTARDIKVGEVFTAKSVQAAFSVQCLFRRQLILNSLRLTAPGVIIAQRKQEVGTAGSQNGMFAFSARHVRVQGAEVLFIDRSVGAEFTYRVKDIELSSDSSGEKIDFDIRGSVLVAADPRPALLTASGWLDFPGKNMQSTFSVTGLDAVDFYPYFSKTVAVGQAGIERAIFDLTGNANALRNAVTALCRMEFSEIAFKPLAAQEEPGRDRRLAVMVVEALKQGEGSPGRPFVQFTHRTTMDAPRLDCGPALGAAFQEKLSRTIIVETVNAEGLGQLPGKLLEGTIKGARGIARGLYDNTIRTGKDLRDAVLDTFFKVKVAPSQER
jgi:hypothetical protein